MKAKKLRQALQELAEEGVVQLFRPQDGAQPLVGVVGTLQLDVLQSRLMGEYGVKIGFDVVPFSLARWVSGDDKAALEAQALVPGIVTTVVKRGIARLSAELCAADEARARLRADAERAVRAAPQAAPLRWNGEPLRLEFTRVEFCDRAAACPGVSRLDGRTLQIAGADVEQIYRGFLACTRLSDLED